MGILASVVNKPIPTKIYLAFLRNKGINEEEYFISLVRGFVEQPVFLEKFRVRPGVSLLSFMYGR